MKQLALALLVSLSLATLAGCSEDSQEQVVDTCIAHCEHVGAAQGCPDAVATTEVDDCKASCPLFIRHLDHECQAAMEAFYLCSMDNYDYQCTEGNDIPGVEFEGDEVDPCEQEAEPLGACLFQP